MTELKLIIQKHPQCLEDSHKLKSILKDYGWSDSKLEVVVNLHELGIVDKIQNGNGFLSQEAVYSISSQQIKRHGTSQESIDEGIRLWVEALGASVQPASKIEPKPNAVPEIPVLPKRRQRNRFEKFLIIFGYICLALLLCMFAVGLKSINEITEKAGWLSVAPVLLAGTLLIMQIRLQKKGFEQLKASAVNTEIFLALGYPAVLIMFIASYAAFAFVGGEVQNICARIVGVGAIYQMLWVRKLKAASSIQTSPPTTKGKNNEDAWLSSSLFFCITFLILFFTFGDLLF